MNNFREMRHFLLIFSTVIAACSPVSQGTDPAPVSSEAASSENAAPSDSLFGQWQVVSVDGRAPDFNPMYLLFASDWWHMQSQCIWSGGDYRIDGDRLDFAAIQRAYEDYDTAAMPPRAMCARGLTDAERKVPQILSAVRDFTLTEGRLTISSPDGDLVARPFPDPIDNPYGFTEFDAATTWGAWNVDSIEGQPLEDAEAIFTFERITVRLGCRYYQWLRPTDASGMYTPLVRRKPFADGCEREASPVEQQLLEALDSIEFRKDVGPDGRIMQAGGKKIRLSR